MMTDGVRSRARALAIVALLALALFGCGNGDGADTPEEPHEPEESTGAEPDTPPSEPAEETGGSAERPELYYPASELFLPDHAVDGYVVDFYASHNDIDETIAWFEDNIEDLDAFDVQDQVVNAHRLWIIERDDAEPGDATRIEIAVSSAHADIGFLAQVSNVVPPDTVIISIARA